MGGASLAYQLDRVPIELRHRTWLRFAVGQTLFAALTEFVWCVVVEELDVMRRDVAIPRCAPATRDDHQAIGAERTMGGHPVEERDPVEKLEANLAHPGADDDRAILALDSLQHSWDRDGLFGGCVNGRQPCRHGARHDVLLGEIPDWPEAEQPVEDDQRHPDQRAGRRDGSQLSRSLAGHARDASHDRHEHGNRVEQRPQWVGVEREASWSRRG